MNLPNKLTLFRIIMVPVFLAVMMFTDGGTVSRIVCAAIYIITCLTDLADGKIARKYGLITDFGKFMDPLADKFIVFAALLGILVKYTEQISPSIFVWAVAIVMFRELAVTSVRLVAAGKEGEVIAASMLGKIKTTTQMVCIITIILESVIESLLSGAFPDNIFKYHPLSYATTAVMTVMTVWSGLDYIVRYRRFLLPEKSEEQ